MKPLEIKGARTRLGYTQKDIADALGISISSYQKKEDGTVKFTEAEKIQLGKILQLNLQQLSQYLFDGELDYFFTHQ